MCPDNILIKQEYGQKCQQKVKFPGDSALVHFWERTFALEAAETTAAEERKSLWWQLLLLENRFRYNDDLM